MKKVKMVPVYEEVIRNGQKIKEIKAWREMKRSDAVRFFDGIKRHIKRGHCDRCSILVGGRIKYRPSLKEGSTIVVLKNQKLFRYKKWKLCKSCFDDKKLGRFESTPDLEDLN